MLRLPPYQLLKSGRVWFWPAIFLPLSGAAFTLLQALFTARIVNAVFMEGRPVSTVTGWFAILLLSMAARALLLWGGEVAAARLAAAVKGFIRIKVLQALFELGPVYSQEKKTGEILTLLTTGLEETEVYLAKYLPQLLNVLVVPLLVLLVVTPVDPLSGLLLLVTAPALPVFLALIGRWAESAQQKQWAKLGRNAGHFLDVLQGLFTLRLFGRSREQAAVITRLSGEVADGTLAVLRIAFLSAFMLELTATISTAIVAVTVGLRLLYGTLTFEPAFMILLLVPEFFQPFRTFGAAYHAGLAGVAALDQVETLAGEGARHAVVPGGNLPEAGAQVEEIAFEDVWFSYPGRTEGGLKGNSFVLRRGETVALTGPSGAGKSTVAALLLGFIQPQQGRITVNGRVSYGLAGKEVAYLPQQPHMFNGSIADNIRMTRPEAALEEVREAARLAELAAVVEALPQGYDTPVGERGYGLSGGEKQRLAMARAFLGKAQVIIMDEPASSLDPLAEEATARTWRRLFTDTITLVITHQPSTLRQADRVLRMENGRLVTGGREEAEA